MPLNNDKSRLLIFLESVQETIGLFLLGFAFLNASGCIIVSPYVLSHIILDIEDFLISLSSFLLNLVSLSIPKSYQNLSPYLSLTNVSPTIHLKIGPRSAGVSLCSRNPPTNKSTSSTWSYTCLNLAISSGNILSLKPSKSVALSFPQTSLRALYPGIP